MFFSIFINYVIIFISAAPINGGASEHAAANQKNRWRHNKEKHFCDAKEAGARFIIGIACLTHYNANET